MHHAEQLEDGIKLVREALRLDPDYTQAKTLFKALKGTRQSLAAAAAAEQQRDFETAKTVYTSLIDAGVPEAAPLYASLYSKRGNAHCRLQDHEAALRDCAKALYVKDDCKSAWLTRRLSLHALGRHEEAFNDMKGLMQRWGQTDTAMKHAYHKAEFELRKSKRVDYYSLLNCRKLSSEGEIKQAYKVKAMECHPDKHGDKTPAQQKEMENKFKVLGEALEILTTPMKRQLYDEGYDKEVRCVVRCTARWSAARHAHLLPRCLPRCLPAHACLCGGLPAFRPTPPCRSSPPGARARPPPAPPPRPLTSVHRQHRGPRTRTGAPTATATATADSPTLGSAYCITFKKKTHGPQLKRPCDVGVGRQGEDPEHGGRGGTA